MNDKMQKAIRDLARRMEAGEPISPADLDAIADDIESEPAKRGKGRPKQEGHRAYDWRLAAFVQFYRRLLPGYRGIKGPTQKAFARMISKTDRKIRHLEAMPASSARTDPNGMEFFGVVFALMEGHQLSDEAAYSIEQDEIIRRGPLMRGIMGEIRRLLNKQ